MKVQVLHILALVALGVAQMCPPEGVLDPCFCDEHVYKGIFCIDPQGEFDLKGVFDRASEHVGDDVIFNDLFLMEIPNIEIEEGAIEHLKFQWIDLVNNENLEYISPRAFNATRNVTRFFQVSLSPSFRNDAPRERDIFDLVQSFPNLETVGVVTTNLTSIPEKAFQNLPLLRTISLEANRISRIGSYAFATGGPNLRLVVLSSNTIPSSGLPADVWSGIPDTNMTHFDLECNEMEFLEQRSFEPLLKVAAYVSVGGRSCGEPPYTAERLYCDERVDWICDIINEHPWKLEGYLCKPEAGVEDIFEYCAGRNNTAH